MTRTVLWDEKACHDSHFGFFLLFKIRMDNIHAVYCLRRVGIEGTKWRWSYMGTTTDLKIAPVMCYLLRL